MGHPLIAFSNWADDAVYSGGAWRNSLPLANFASQELSEVARSASTDPDSTWFTADLLKPKPVRVFGWLNHNIDLAGQYRLRGSNDPTFSTAAYDSGMQRVWPRVYPMSARDWSADNFWFGTFTKDEIKGYPRHLIVLLPATKRLRYWRLDVDDAGNPAGFIQAGRPFYGDAWQPSNGVAYGAEMGWEDPTTLAGTLSGAEYPDPKPPYRVARVKTHFMPDDEAYSQAFEIQRRSGNWREVIYIHDPDDTIHAIRRRFPARLRSTSAIANPYPNAHEADWELKEVLP